MSIVNNVQLIGNLGQDPELRVSEKGTKVLKVSIATNDDYKDNEGRKVEQVDWHNVVFFGSRADIVSKYCEKGSKVCVTGKIKTRTYEDANNVTKFITEIIAQDVLFLDNKRK